MIRAFQFIIVLMAWIIVACSNKSAPTPTTTMAPTLTERNYEGVTLVESNNSEQVNAPPLAWLIFDNQALPAHNAAFQTIQAHVDPAEAFPNLPQIIIPLQSDFMIVIESTSITEFRASIMDWDPKINPLPLFESQGQLLSYTTKTEQEFNIYSLRAIYPNNELFLEVFISFLEQSSDTTGNAHYLWRITSGE